MKWLKRIRKIFRNPPRTKRLKKQVPEKYNLIVCADPPCDWRGPHEQLYFRGYKLIEVSAPWHTELAEKWRVSGDVYNRAAIYQTLDNTYIAEVARTNPLPIILGLEALRNNVEPIPFMAYAKSFGTIEEAASWIRGFDLYREGNISDEFMRQWQQVGA